MGIQAINKKCQELGVARLKIIKHGNKFDKNKIQTCGLCGCKFEYDDDDVVINRDFCFTVYPPLYKAYIRCPECNTEIYLGTKNY